VKDMGDALSNNKKPGLTAMLKWDLRTVMAL
jgi:hypothetical protein